jgi:hypothetical protein
VEAPNAWMVAAKFENGKVFRGGSGAGRLFRDRRLIRTRSVPSRSSGRKWLDWTVGVSCHGLRLGYLTEAANYGIPLPEAMERHDIVNLAKAYGAHSLARFNIAQRELFARQLYQILSLDDDRFEHAVCSRSGRSCQPETFSGD